MMLWLTLIGLMLIIHPAELTAQTNSGRGVDRVTEAAKLLGVIGAPATTAGNLDETLKPYGEFAVNHHPDVTIGNSRLDESVAARQAVRARFHPTLSVFAGRSQGELDNKSTDATTKSNSSEVGARLRWNLFNGGADTKTLDAANSGQEVAEINLKKTIINIKTAAMKAALGLNTAAMNLVLAEAAAQSAADIRAMSQRKLKAGIVGKIDLHKTEVREAETSAQLAQAQLEKDIALVSFLRATGQKFTEDSRESSQLIQGLLNKALLPPEDVNGNPKDQGTAGQKFRSLEAESAKALLKKSEDELAVQRRKRWLPAIDLTGSWSNEDSRSQNSSSSPTTSESDTTNRYIALELNWKIWSPTDDAAIQEAISSKTRATATLENELFASQQRFEENLAKRRLLALSMASYRNAWERSHSLYQAQVSLYEAGSVDIFEVITADSQRLSALRAWLQARNTLIEAWLDQKAMQAD